MRKDGKSSWKKVYMHEMWYWVHRNKRWGGKTFLLWSTNGTEKVGFLIAWVPCAMNHRRWALPAGTMTYTASDSTKHTVRSMKLGGEIPWVNSERDIAARSVILKSSVPKLVMELRIVVKRRWKYRNLNQWRPLIENDWRNNTFLWVMK